MNANIIHTLIDQASTPVEFAEAGRVVRSLIKQGKGDPGVMCHLAFRGHVLIAAAAPNWEHRHAVAISATVASVLATEPD